MNNSLEKATQKPKFSVVLQSDAMKNLINNTLGDQKVATRFIASISSAVSQNPALQECDPGSIISAGLVGEALGLSPSPILGQYYLVPYKDKKNGRIVAQIQIGYLGYIQLALNSNKIVDIDAMEIREGEVIGRDCETGKYLFKFITDEEERESKKIIGYMAYVTLANGMKKSIYWSKEKMEKHALEYSQGYKSDKRNGTAYTFWSKNFNEMAFKTVLRYLIKKWCPLSTEKMNEIAKDQAVINKETGAVEYVDNTKEFDDDGISTPVFEPEYVQEVGGKYRPQEAEAKDGPAQQPVQEEQFNEGLFGDL